MDLSKVFDNLNHELLLVKVKAYGLDNNSVTLTRSMSLTEFSVVK